MIWDDNFAAIPAEPRYVVEKPYGSRPFTVSDKGLLVTYKAPKYDGSTASLRAEVAPRTDPDNKVGIRLPKGGVHTFETSILIPTDSPSQSSKTVLMQWYQKKGLNPPLSLELVRNEFRLVRLYSLTDPKVNPGNREVIDSWTCERGRPYTVKLTTKFQPDDEGFVILEVNGLAFTTSGPNCYNCPDDILPKLGIYRPGVKDGTVPVGQVTKARFGYWRIS